MSRVHQLRESIERKLDRWEARAAAMEAALAERRADVAAEVQASRDALRRAAAAVAERLEASKGLAEEARGEIVGALEHLQLQLALGKAETRDAVAEQRERIATALAGVEATLERHLHRLDDRAHEAAGRLAAAGDRAEAELELAELYAEAELESTKLELAREARAVRATIGRFRTELAEKRHRAEARTSKFEKEMADAFEHVRRAFRDLLG